MTKRSVKKRAATRASQFAYATQMTFTFKANGQGVGTDPMTPGLQNKIPSYRKAPKSELTMQAACGNSKVASGKWQKCLYSQQKRRYKQEEGACWFGGCWNMGCPALMSVERRPEIMYALIPHLNSTARTTHQLRQAAQPSCSATQTLLSTNRETLVGGPPFVVCGILLGAAAVTLVSL